MRSQDPPPEQPALLVAASREARAELARVVGQALNGAPVRLADDALTRESHLIITRRQPRDSSRQPLMGRITEKPERFELVEQAGSCILIQERTGRRWPLHVAQCVPSGGR